jgi:hypothetical protein
MRAARMLSGWSVPPDRFAERPPIEDNGVIRKVPWQRKMWTQALLGLPMAEIEILNSTWSILKTSHSHGTVAFGVWNGRFCFKR